MANTGQILEFHGAKTKILISSKESKGALSLMESIIQPNKKLSSIAHIHPSQDETIEILGGELTVLKDGITTKLKVGEKITFQKGSLHNFWNDGTVPATYLVEHKPAMQIQQFIETFVELAKAGKLKNNNGLSDKIQMSVVMDYFKNTMTVPMPMKLGIKIFAFAGRIMGRQKYVIGTSGN